MFDPTQIEDDDDYTEITEADRWAILITLVLGCTAGAWAMTAIIDMALETWK